jgi:hypothetical protein
MRSIESRYLNDYFCIAGAALLAPVSPDLSPNQVSRANGSGDLCIQLRDFTRSLHAVERIKLPVPQQPQLSACGGLLRSTQK